MKLKWIDSLQLLEYLPLDDWSLLFIVFSYIRSQHIFEKSSNGRFMRSQHRKWQTARTNLKCTSRNNLKKFTNPIRHAQLRAIFIQQSLFRQRITIYFMMSDEYVTILFPVLSGNEDWSNWHILFWLQYYNIIACQIYFAENMTL